MKAARIRAHGGLDAIEWCEIPRPSPSAGEVLVELRTSGINSLDTWVRRGVPGHNFPLPLTLGADGAGVVRKVGDGVSEVKVGDEVILSPGVSCGHCSSCLSGLDHYCRHYHILGEGRDGTCAEYVVVPAVNTVARPPELSWEESGALALVALTAWGMLVDRAKIQPGEEVLVIAGGSGVGSMGIQIAKLYGCRVMATAGGEDKCARLGDLGADEVIDHSREDIAARVRELTHKRGVDVVFEHVGEATWSASLQSLARGGRLVTCGATTGAMVECNLRMIFFKKLSILGSTMGPKGMLAKLVRFAALKRLRTVVGRRLPASEVQEAHRLLEERQVFGKVVLIRELSKEESS